MLALLWWLRWVMLAVLIITAVTILYHWYRRLQDPAVVPRRTSPIRWRYAVRNPGDFFTRYLPDQGLLPKWYGQLLAAAGVIFKVPYWWWRVVMGGRR